MHNLLQASDLENQKFVGPGLQVYWLAMPLPLLTFQSYTHSFSFLEMIDVDNLQYCQFL